jgi:hypothetical protein
LSRPLRLRSTGVKPLADSNVTDLATPTEARIDRDTPSRPRMDQGARFALVAFVLVAVVAFGLFLGFGRRQSFFLDDWDFLAHRDGGDVRDLLRPHNEHWSTLPILVYRGLWRIFGVRTYVPYQAILTVLHLIAAALLRVVMRHSGVGPWIATAAASLFVLFGAGYENVVWAFQVGFVGALVLGLTQLLLADHDGPLDGRDWLALLAGFAGLVCSGVAVTMTIAVGLAMLLRRGWRVALFHVAPLGVVYTVWWVTEARGAYATPGGALGPWLRFVGTGLGTTFDAMGQLPGVGIALGVLLIVGLALALRGLDRAELRRRAAAPAALLSGAIVFLMISGLGRATSFGPEFARSSRYVHLVAALSLPSVAVAAQAVAQRWRMLAPAVVVLLLIGIPGNVDVLAEYEPFSQSNPLPSIVQSNDRTTAATCETAPVNRRLDKGQSLRINGGVARVFAAGGPAFSLAFDPADGHTLTALAGPVRFRLAPDDATRPVMVCGGTPLLRL